MINTLTSTPNINESFFAIYIIMFSKSEFITHYLLLFSRVNPIYIRNSFIFNMVQRIYMKFFSAFLGSSLKIIQKIIYIRLTNDRSWDIALFSVIKIKTHDLVAI